MKLRSLLPLNQTCKKCSNDFFKWKRNRFRYTHRKGEKTNIKLQKCINLKEREQEKKKGTEKSYKSNQKTNNKMAISAYLPIITLNVNGLNAPIKRHRVVEWIKKKKRYIYMLPTQNSPQNLRHMQTESERMEKHLPCQWRQKNLM